MDSPSMEAAAAGREGEHVCQSRLAAIIFDYGNVLARTLNPTPRATWARRLGLSPGELQRIVHNDHSWVAAQHGQITVEAYWQDVGATLGLTPTDTARLRASFYEGDVLNVELIAHLDQWRAVGIRTALLSNFSMELRHFLTAQALQQHFDHIVISAEIGVMKPALAAYQEVLSRLRLAGHRCAFIDDQPSNVHAARALGIHGIVFSDNFSCINEIDRLLTDPSGCYSSEQS
jgi:putative hydrolase of the HAD superfamily